jgi:hypothetical protein
MGRSAAKVSTKVPAAVMPTAKVPAAMMTAAEMRVAVTTAMAAPVTTSMPATVAAAFRDGQSSRRQRDRQDNDGNPDSEF